MTTVTMVKTARSPLDHNIPDDVVEQACAAYWWHDNPGVYTWDHLVKKADHRIPIWREKMRAALTAIQHEWRTKPEPDSPELAYTPEAWLLMPPDLAFTAWPWDTMGDWMIVADAEPQSHGLAPIATGLTEANARIAVQAPKMLRLLRRYLDEHEAMLDWITATDPWDDPDYADSRALLGEVRALIQELDKPTEATTNDQ